MVTNDPPHPFNKGLIQGIICRITGMDLASQQVATRFSSGCHQLQLGQVRSVIFALAVLHDALARGGVIPPAGCAVYPHSRHLHLIDRHRARPQLGFDRFPGVRLTQAPGDNPQAIIIHFHISNGLGQQALQRALMPLSPLLDGGFPMISLRQDRGQPHRGQPAIAESLMVPMIAQIVIQHFGQMQVLHQPNQQRNITYSFMKKVEFLCHRTENIPKFDFCPLSLRER